MVRLLRHGVAYALFETVTQPVFREKINEIFA